MNPPEKVAFDDAGQPCGVADFPHAEIADRLDGTASDDGADDESRVRRETLFRLLAFLTTRAGTKRTGQRALVLAFLAGATPFRKQKQLAARLKVSPSRASRICKSARAEFARLARGI